MRFYDFKNFSTNHLYLRFIESLILIDQFFNISPHFDIFRQTISVHRMSNTR